MTERKHFVVLDGMRGVAALGVVALHLCIFNDVPFIPPHAALAVDFFFCLSGFVIAHAYDPAFAQGRIDFSTFAWKRIARLYPMILAGLALGVVVALLGVAHGASARLGDVLIWTICGALLLPLGMLFHNVVTFPINPVIWSLFFETVANVVYGLMGARRVPRWLAVLLLSLSAAAVVVAAVLGGGVIRLGFDTPYWLPGGLARVAYPFLAGVLIARLGWARGRQLVPSGVLLGVTAVLLLWPTIIFSWSFDSLAILLVFPALIVLGARASPGPALTRVCKVLGDVSYPLYTIHWPLVLILAKVDSHVLHLGSPVMLSALELVLIPIAAWLALKLYDEPVRALLARLRPSARGATRAAFERAA